MLKSLRCYVGAATNTEGPPAIGVTRLSHRRLIRLSGKDAPKFLQGLISNNLGPTTTTPFYSAFMDARGRMLWDAFIFPDSNPKSAEWTCFIEVDSTEADNLLRHLKRHKLRSKIQLQLVEEEAGGVWASWQSGDSNNIPGGLPDPRAPGFGQRILISGESIKGGPIREVLDKHMVDLRWYHLRRYMYGIPEGPQEIPPTTALPMESNIDLMNGIDFRKGCYVGQELTIRTKHTGVVRKRILPVQLYRGNEVLPTAETPAFDPQWTFDDPSNEVSQSKDIKQLSDDGTIKKGRAAGKLLGNIGNVGLALCRLEMMTDIRVSAEGGSWRPGMEFGVQYPEAPDADIRVKPMVPAWLREREQQMWSKQKAN
ncbi:Aminomethyltransferase folate-binding domain-containing protein [Mytilinidion resinicola]|uniref:Iron-sulfur cluster assembly factor IBA57 homolog, mitochondrial n=1 Tax=Mytilinidion resinicola TaxID=574789 RepID=A0A6A6YL09_9PEZI|nr:Aminomethyltransferase folate-binding domain-containing protein [Mytilinidion resinicola]KAF2809243.1 Aminomethyltransferase folate-binding domain-containing protein [Mytilinidion resinicola]